MRSIPLGLLIGVAVGAAAPAFAGTVDVTFTGSENYADAGDMPHREEANLRTLAGHLKSLGERHLPAGQVLKIEVLDVDLAGETRPWLFPERHVRIARGGADTPSVTLRYSLEADGRVLRSGEERVTDLAYLHHSGLGGPREPLRHEKRMLDGWFSERFVDTAAAR